MQLTEQEQIRRDKLKALRQKNINPYPAEEFKYTHTSEKIKTDFEEGKKGGDRWSFNVKTYSRKSIICRASRC